MLLEILLSLKRSRNSVALVATRAQLHILGWCFIREGYALLVECCCKLLLCNQTLSYNSSSKAIKSSPHPHLVWVKNLETWSESCFKIDQHFYFNSFFPSLYRFNPIGDFFSTKIFSFDVTTVFHKVVAWKLFEIKVYFKCCLVQICYFGHLP